MADAVVNRRVELGMRTRKQLADTSGLTVKTLGEIERAERTSYDPATLAVVEQTLQWPAGTISGIASSLASVRAAMDAHIEQLRHDVEAAEDATLDPSRPLDAKLILLRIRDAELPPEDRARLLANLTVLLEWTQSRIDAAKSPEERLRDAQTAVDVAGMQRPVRERHDAGR